MIRLSVIGTEGELDGIDIADQRVEYMRRRYGMMLTMMDGLRTTQTRSVTTKSWANPRMNSESHKIMEWIRKAAIRWPDASWSVRKKAA